MATSKPTSVNQEAERPTKRKAQTKRSARIDNAAMARRMDMAREKLELSWIELNRRVGEKLGWSATTTNYLNRIRYNKVDPTKTLIEAIAESLCVRSGWLMDGHGPMGNEGTFSALPGYEEALAVAKERYKHRIPDTLWDEVGMLPAPASFKSISPEELHDMAMFLLRSK